MAQLYNRIDKIERTSYIPPCMYNSYYSIPPPIQPSTDALLKTPPKLPPPIQSTSQLERHVKCLSIKIKDTTVVFSSSLIIIEDMVSAKTALITKISQTSDRIK